METIKNQNENQEEMEILHQLFVKAIKHYIAKTAQEWMGKHRFTVESTFAGYVPLEFNRGRKSERKIELLAKAGMLTPFNKTGSQALFGRNSIVFPLKNEKNKIVNFYSTGIEKEKTAYLNENGIYPGYPKPLTERLMIVDTILDAASLLESKVLKNKESVIALFDGKLMPQHEKAITALKRLKEIIYISAKKD